MHPLKRCCYLKPPFFAQPLFKIESYPIDRLMSIKMHDRIKILIFCSNINILSNNVFRSLFRIQKERIIGAIFLSFCYTKRTTVKREIILNQTLRTGRCASKKANLKSSIVLLKESIMKK